MLKDKVILSIFIVLLYLIFFVTINKINSFSYNINYDQIVSSTPSNKVNKKSIENGINIANDNDLIGSIYIPKINLNKTLYSPNSSKNKPNINPVNNQGYQRSNTQRNNYNHHAQYTYPDNVRNNNNNINNNMGVNNNNININNNLPTFEDLQRKNENLFDQLKLDETVYLNKK